MTFQKPDPSSKRRAGVLFTFLPYAWPYIWKIGFALFILFLDALSDLATPWPVKLIFDNVLLGKSLPSPWSWLIAAAVAKDHRLLLAVLCGDLVWLALFSAGSALRGAEPGTSRPRPRTPRWPPAPGRRTATEAADGRSAATAPAISSRLGPYHQSSACDRKYSGGCGRMQDGPERLERRSGPPPPASPAPPPLTSGNPALARDLPRGACTRS